MTRALLGDALGCGQRRAAPDDVRTTSSGRNSDLLVDVVVVGVALGEQQLGRRAAEQLAGLADRAERDGRRAGELDVVVADDRQLAGHVDAHARHLLEQAEGDEVVGAERRRRPPGPGQADEPLAGAPALGDVERRRLEHGRRIRRSRPAASSARRVPCRRSATCTVVIGPPTKAIRWWPCSHRWVTASSPPSTSSTPTLHHAAPGTRSTSTTGMPCRASASSCAVSWSTGVIRMPRTRCSSEQLEVVGLAGGVAVAVAHVQRHAVGPGGLLDALGDVGEERVGGVEHQVGDRPAASGPQLAPRLVAHEPELGDGVAGPAGASPSLTMSGRLRTLETVPTETPARAATSFTPVAPLIPPDRTTERIQPAPDRY